MIVEKLDVSVLVEAGAGSGKTTSLVERMLALIASGKSSVDKMAAVTFTRKAAAELKGRFQIALEDNLRISADEGEKNRLRTALENLELLFAGTIHSFCGRLLRERPIEAKLDPDFEELEENENIILRDRCWSEYLEGLYAEGASILEEIMALGLDPAELIDTYKSVALYPEVEIVRKKYKRPDFSKEKKQLRSYLKKAWEVLPRKVPAKGWDPLQEILRQAWRRCRYLDLEKDSDFVKLLAGLDKSGGVTLNRWPDGDIAKEQRAIFEKLREALVTPCLKRWRSYCHYHIVELVVPAVEHFRSVREKNSLMSFHDLLIKSAELLRHNPEVRRYFQERFTHILVDEFQDTDPIQAEVILYLAGEDVEEKSWRKVKVKPGALFIVGDPKQSIYRFRRADIDAYNEVKKIINNSGGHTIPLTANFRSVPEVCDWVNPIFENKFPAEATQCQAPFEPLDPYRKSEGGGVRCITIGKVRWNNQREIALQDAERIATWINLALEGNFKVLPTEQEGKEGEIREPYPGDFMILLRYKAHLPIYARALEARGIPYDVTGGSAFKDSDEIWHLINLLSSVAEPEDQVSLVATLRGQFFGISDDLLYRFRKGGGSFSYLRSQDGCEDEDARQKITRAFSELQQFYRWSRTRPPVAVLSLIMDRLGIIPLALTREMGESRAGNLLKALELALWESTGSLTSFADMVERLMEYYEEIEVEEMSAEPGKKNAVRIMNLHKAKGLESTVVFLADPLKDALHSPEIHISRLGKSEVGYFVASCQKSEFKREVVGLPPDWEKFEILEQEYQEAEAQRLLYVATTRAKQLLVVSRYAEKSDKGAWKDLYPYLDKVEELETPEKEIVKVAEGKIDPEIFKAGRQEIADRISSIKERSYQTESVTHLAKASSEKVPFSEDSYKGMSWGRIIHRMLEALAKDESINLELMAENLLKEEERSLSDRYLAVETVKAVITSDLWGRMKNAHEALIEVPFSLKIEETDLPKIISGTIDLVFKETEGWVIADYKTDKVDGNLDSLVAYHRPQVEMYRDFWKKVSGEMVKEVGLYFTDIAKWIPV
jgi:ATP-dependent helicase/nuclease subunit A